MRFSTPAILATLLLHGLLCWFAIHPWHHYNTSEVMNVPVTLQLITKDSQETHLSDLSFAELNPEPVFVSEINQSDVDGERYYLPQELSQPVVVLQDDTASLNIPIHKIVIMKLYINETGHVDDLVFEDKGSTTEEEQQQLTQAFSRLVFLPGMRGTKVVKALYRIQLEINRRLIIHR